LLDLEEDAPKPIESGTLVVTIEGLGDPISKSIRFVNKPWVHDFDSFVSQRPNEYLILARSELKSTETDSHLDAVENAARNISQAIIQARYTNLNHMWRHIDELTRKRLMTGDWIEDRFVQELKRPYGSVWRAAILIRLDEDDLVQLMNQHQRFVVRYHHRQLSAAASIVGILIVSVLLFWGLNLWTKGYHRGKITLSIICFAGVGLVAIYYAIARELLI
jgi:hypothetical protein